jgi:hypothetical protein
MVEEGSRQRRRRPRLREGSCHGKRRRPRSEEEKKKVRIGGGEERHDPFSPPFALQKYDEDLRVKYMLHFRS